MLSLVIFLPLVTAILVMCIPGSYKTAIKTVSLTGMALCFLATCLLMGAYRSEKWTGHTRAERYLREIAKTKLLALAATPEGAALNGREAEILGPDDPKERAKRPPPGQPLDIERSLLVHDKEWVRAAYGRIYELRRAALAPMADDLEFSEHAEWIPSFRINYFVAADGLSLPLIFLTALLGVICLAYSWTVEKATKGYFALFLLLETGLFGVFAALDFFLFYVFWEIVLLPMYFLIGVWGGPRRIYAAIKFFIYTLVGSVLMLLAMLALYFYTAKFQPTSLPGYVALPESFRSFNVLTLVGMLQEVSHHAEKVRDSVQFHDAFMTILSFQKWIFIGLFVAFAIKVPVFPFHTWLPDAHVEAPTAVSVILAGVLLKMGGYGFFRFSYPLAPLAGSLDLVFYGMAGLGLVNMVYGALCAMAQTDFKSLVAYSSISHMGYVLIGLAAGTAAGVEGAALQMFTHGISSAMMFLIVGVLYERAHHRVIDNFGGIGLQMPYYTGLAIVGFFASLGLPGLCGFVSEAFVFVGIFNSAVPSWMVYTAVLTILFTAAYILWCIQRVYLGPLKPEYEHFEDVNRREIFSLAPLAVLAVAVGVYPAIILDFMHKSLETVRTLMMKG